MDGVGPLCFHRFAFLLKLFRADVRVSVCEVPKGMVLTSGWLHVRDVALRSGRFVSYVALTDDYKGCCMLRKFLVALPERFRPGAGG